MIPFTPNFEWIEMFIYEVFPYDISYNSVGATRFSTDVIMVDSGHDQRSSRWDQPLMEYDIAYGVRTMEHLHGLIAFFRAMRGRKHAFLYHDYVDYRSTIAVDEETRIAPPTGPFDQQLGIGNHVTKSFQLIKRYPTPGGLLDQLRPIYKPQQGTVQVGINGVEVTNYTVDYARGVITFVTNFSRTGLNAMTLAASGANWRISNAPAGTFTGLVAGDKVVTTGWLNPNNNVGEATLSAGDRGRCRRHQLHLFRARRLRRAGDQPQRRLGDPASGAEDRPGRSRRASSSTCRCASTPTACRSPSRSTASAARRT